MFCYVLFLLLVFEKKVVVIYALTQQKLRNLGKMMTSSIMFHTGIQQIVVVSPVQASALQELTSSA